MEIVKHENNKKKRGNPNWVKGISGNPNGRPKNDLAMTILLRQLGGTIPAYPKKTGEQETRTRKEIACQRIWDIACYGDETNAIKACNAIMERLDGKVTQPIGGEGGQPIRHIIEVIDQETKQALTEFLNK